MRKKTKKFILTDRDRKMLCYIFESKVASYQDLYLEFFPGSNMMNLRRRIRNLRSHDLLSSQFHFQEGRWIATCNVTKQAIPIIEKELLHKLVRHELKSDKVKHDLVLCQIARQLRKIEGSIHVLTENILQSLDPLF